MDQILGMLIVLSLLTMASGCIITGISLFRIAFGWKNGFKNMIDWTLTEGMDYAVSETEKEIDKVLKKTEKEWNQYFKDRAE